MIDYHNTFAPVVNWYIGRVIIMISEMAGWESIKIDYVLAFSFAPMYRDFYFYLPAGFYAYGEKENETYFLRLKKNRFETSQGSANKFSMLKTELEDEVFKQNKKDPCLSV